MSAKKLPIKAIGKTPKKQAAVKNDSLARKQAAVVADDGNSKTETGRTATSKATMARQDLAKQFTGRLLVRLEPKAPIATVIRHAKANGLQLTTMQDGTNGIADGLLPQALDKFDGVIFSRLNIAVINEAGAERMRRLQEQRNSPFLTSERERYLRATSKGKAKTGAMKDSSVVTWGIQAINAASSKFTGKGVKMAILDTGFDFTHPDFNGRTLHRKSFAGTRQAKDKEGHGTHCAGIAGGGRKSKDGARYGVAPGARLYIGKILDDAGEGTDGQALAGIEWALEKGCQVISMSFGASVEDGDAHSEIFEQVAQTAMASNCLLIAATGNESDRSEGFVSSVNHPANCPSVMAVAALTQTLEVADYSCAGSNANGGQVDIAAPGDNILSTRIGGGYRRQSGTSMATAFVAGIAALLWEQYPDASAAEIWVKLIQQARRLALPASEVCAGLVYVR